VITVFNQTKEFMMKMYIQNAILAASLLILAGCATTTWDDMSESEIAIWKSGGFNPATAQEWEKDGFTAEQAGGWSKAQFTNNDAKKWAKENFSPEEALTWRQADFSLKSAVESRTKGLTPVKGN
jgi:hypothetical protein